MAAAAVHSYPILIRFIRRNHDQAYDDTIRITCENLGAAGQVPRLYKYEFRTLDLPRVQNYYFVSEDELLQTVHNAFVMARVDRDPYRSIQVDIPGFPSVMLDREDLAQQEILEIVMFNIQTCLRAWPSAMQPQPQPQTQPQQQRQLMTALIVRPIMADSSADNSDEDSS